jgi:hypothetical protein
VTCVATQQAGGECGQFSLQNLPSSVCQHRRSPSPQIKGAPGKAGSRGTGQATSHRATGTALGWTAAQGTQLSQLPHGPGYAMSTLNTWRPVLEPGSPDDLIVVFSEHTGAYHT